MELKLVGKKLNGWRVVKTSLGVKLEDLRSDYLAMNVHETMEE